MEHFEPYTLTLKQVANALHISRTTLWRRIQEGELQTIELGGRRLITPQSLNAYLNHLQTKQNIPTTNAETLVSA